MLAAPPALEQTGPQQVIIGLKCNVDLYPPPAVHSSEQGLESAWTRACKPSKLSLDTFEIDGPEPTNLRDRDYVRVSGWSSRRVEGRLAIL